MNGVTCRDPRRMRSTTWQSNCSLPGLALVLLLHVAVADAACRDGPSTSGSASCAQRIPVTPSRLQTEWKMEATAHIASLVIRQMYCKLEGGAPCGNVGSSGEKLGSLKDWASKDEGWERILSSLSLYELAKRFWQQEDYDRALVAVEQSIALKLFPYGTVALLERWQRNLVGQGSQFVRQKNELADALMLKADCLLELGQNEKGDVRMLEQAMQALELASALMNSSSQQQAAPDLMANMKTMAAQLASAAAEMLPKLRIPKLHELMDKYSLTCNGCVEKQQLLGVLVEKLRLPVVVVQATGRVEPREDPLARTPGIYIWQPGQPPEQPLLRVLSQLLSLVHTRFLEDLQVPCTEVDKAGACRSRLPSWLSSDGTAPEHGSGSGLGSGSAGSGSAQRSARGQRSGSSGESCQTSSCSVEGKGRTGGGAGSVSGEGVHGRVCSGVIAGSTQERNRCANNEMAGDGSESIEDVPVRRGRRSSSGTDSCNGSNTDSRTTYTYVADMGALIEKMLKSDLRNVQGMLKALDRITGGGSGVGVTGGQQTSKACPSSGSSTASPPSLDDSCGQPHRHGTDPAAVLSHFLNGDHDLDEDYLTGSTRSGTAASSGGSTGAAATAGGGVSRGVGGGGAGGYSPSGDLNLDGDSISAAHSRGRGQGFGPGRETSDRQLQEQLAKASGSGTPDKDSPLIPITLCMFIFGVIGVCFGLKHKRRIHRLWASHVTRTSRTTRTATKDPKPAAAAAVVAPSPKHMAATLRDAMASSDTAKLESAILLAESLEFDQPVLQKARAALQQRKRKERERAAAASARERALRKDAERRRGKAGSRRSGSCSDGGGGGGAAASAEAHGGRRKGSLLSGLFRFITMCFTSKQAAADDRHESEQSSSGHKDDGDLSSKGRWQSSSASDTCASESPSQDSDLQPYNDTGKHLLSKSGSSRDIRTEGTIGTATRSGRGEKRGPDDDLRVARTEDSAEAYMLLFGHLSRSESGTDSDGWQEPAHNRRKWHAAKSNITGTGTGGSTGPVLSVHSASPQGASSTNSMNSSSTTSAHSVHTSSYAHYGTSGNSGHSGHYTPAVADHHPPSKLPRTRPSPAASVSPTPKPPPAPITPLAAPPPAKHGRPLSTKARLTIPQSTRTTLTPHSGITHTHSHPPVPAPHPVDPPKSTSSWLGWLAPQAAAPSPPKPPSKPTPSAPHSTPTRTDKYRYAAAAKTNIPPSHPSARSSPSTTRGQTLCKPKTFSLDPNAPPYLPSSFQTPRTPQTPPPPPPYSSAYPNSSPTPSDSTDSSRKPNLPPLNLPTSSPYPSLCGSLEQFGIISSPETTDHYFPQAHALPISLYNTLSMDSTSTPPALSQGPTSHPHPDPSFSHPFSSSLSQHDSSHTPAYSLFSPVPHDSTSPSILPSLLQPPPTSSYLLPLTSSPSPFPTPLAPPTSNPTSLPSTSHTAPTSTTAAPGFYSMFTGGNLWTPDFPTTLTSSDEGAWSEAPKRLSGWRSFDHEQEVEDNLAAMSHQVGETVLGSSYDLPDATEWMQEMLKHVVD